MESAIKSLSNNLEELKTEVDQEEKQFKEFTSKLEQNQQVQAQIIQFPCGTPSSGKSS